MNGILMDIGQLIVVAVFFMGLLYLMRKLWPQWTGGKTPRGRDCGQIIKALKTLRVAYEDNDDVLVRIDLCIREIKKLRKPDTSTIAFLQLWAKLKEKLVESANLAKVPEDLKNIVPIMIERVDAYLTKL